MKRQREACNAQRTLHIGSDDQSKIYLNGTEIYRNPKGRVLIRDQDRVANITLKPGPNLLVFKVINATGDWSACARFLDADGRPAQGIQIRLTP